MNRLRSPLRDDRPQGTGDAVRVREDVLLAGGFLLERDLDALVQVADDLQPLADERGVELHLRKIVGSG